MAWLDLPHTLARAFGSQSSTRPTVHNPYLRRAAAALLRFRRFNERTVPTVLRRTVRSYAMHACSIYAASIAFFGMLALFPLILLLISLFKYVVSVSDAMALVLGRLIKFFPGSATLVYSAIDTITADHPVFVGVSLLGLLWSSMGVFLTMGYAFNRVWNLPADRNLLAQYAIAAVLTLSVGLVVLISLVITALANLVRLLEGFLQDAGVPGIDNLTLVASNAADMAIVAGASAFLYRLLPKADIQWRDVLVPSLLMAMVWEIAKLGFAWYLATVAHVNIIYGPIAAVAGLMLWMFVSAILLLFGAELSHQIARLRIERGKRPAMTVIAGGQAYNTTLEEGDDAPEAT